MATVYRAHDQFSDTSVALKIVHPGAFVDEFKGTRHRKLFFNEVKILGMLDHPNIVSVCDAGFEDGHCYIAMELVAGGRTLHCHTRPETLLPMKRVVHMVFKCAKALDYAHRKGVVHRDIKPRNILLTPEEDIKISDFSVALRTGLDVTDTQVDGYLGSPLYMSPEQVRGEPLDHRSDLFSLGVLMYELLTGKLPFLGDSIASVIYQIAEKPHVPIREVRADVPEALARIVDRSLSKDPENRCASAMVFAADLSRVFDPLGMVEEAFSRPQKFDMVSRLSFFDEFSESEIWEMLNAGVWRDYEAGGEIVQEGEVDNSFFVIVRGEVTVRKSGVALDTLRHGDCFGEAGLLAGKQRATSVVASGPVSALEVRSALIARTSKDTQLKFHRVFLHKVVERLSRADARLSGN